MKLPFRLGFIGLGIMGREMVKNLIKNNIKPVVYNRTIKKCLEFENLGCITAYTPAMMGEMVDTVILMVENDDAVKNILEGAYGLFSTFKPSNRLINMSTISLRFSVYLKNECYKRGIKFFDCPVSGSKKQAENGELVILASGDKKGIDELEVVLKCFGKEIIYAGDVPNGTILKLSVNLLLASMITGLVESSIFAQKTGLDVKLIFEVIKRSPVLNCGFFIGKENNILNNDFSPAFSVKNLLKDIRYMKDAIEIKKTKLPLISVIEKIFQKAYESGFYNEDITAIKKIYN